MAERIQLAAGGPTFSRIVFGVMKWGQWGWNYNTKEMLHLIEQSIEQGITTFDHADIYGDYTTEQDFGNALVQKPYLRQKMELVTKCSIKMKTPNRPQHRIKSYDTSREHILKSVENSLQQLQTDYIDLLLIHRPSPLMDPDEIAEAFTQLKDDGKVLYFGVSNFTTSQFDLLNSRFPLVTNQVEASILHLPPFLDGTFDQCLKHRIAPMAWSPLGGGSIFQENPDERSKRIRSVALKLGEKYDGKSMDQVLLAWLMQHPSRILPVIGTGRIERLKAAEEATQFKMTTEEWFMLWEASQGQEVP